MGCDCGGVDVIPDGSANGLLAATLKDLTVRTTLIATLYQSTHAAGESCAEHAQIVAALEAGDQAQAIALLRAHIGSVAQHLSQDAAADDPLGPLRAALSPVQAGRSAAARATPAPSPRAARAPRRRALFTNLIPAAPPSTPKKEP